MCDTKSQTGDLFSPHRDHKTQCEAVRNEDRSSTFLRSGKQSMKGQRLASGDFEDEALSQMFSSFIEDDESDGWGEDCSTSYPTQQTCVTQGFDHRKSPGLYSLEEEELHWHESGIEPVAVDEGTSSFHFQAPFVKDEEEQPSSTKATSQRQKRRYSMLAPSYPFCHHESTEVDVDEGSVVDPEFVLPREFEPTPLNTIVDLDAPGAVSRARKVSLCATQNDSCSGHDDYEPICIDRGSGGCNELKEEQFLGSARSHSAEDTACPLPRLALFDSFVSSMKKSQLSQESIHAWDSSMGLKRSHSKVMHDSSKTRSLLQEFVLKTLKGEDSASTDVGPRKKRVRQRKTKATQKFKYPWEE